MLSTAYATATDRIWQRADPLFQSIDQAHLVAVFDLEKRVLWANENFSRAFGYRAEQVIGQQHLLGQAEHGPESPAILITRVNHAIDESVRDCDLEYWRHDAIHISVEVPD